MGSNVATVLEIVKNFSPEERAEVLEDLVEICSRENSTRPRVVRDADGRVKAFFLDLFPTPSGPPPELTEEDVAEIRRRVEDRSNRLSYEEFSAGVRSHVREARGKK